MARRKRMKRSKHYVDQYKRGTLLPNNNPPPITPAYKLLKKRKRKLVLLADKTMDEIVSLEDVPSCKELVEVFDQSLYHKGKFGRKYAVLKTPQELVDKFKRYLLWANKYKKPLTLERCAIFLGMDVRSLRRYMERDEFAPILHKIRDFILSDKVERLNHQQAVTGIIFDLKNNEGWKDQQEVDLKGEFTFIGKLREAANRAKQLGIHGED